MRRSSATWTELRGLIMARIADGTYPPGALIPTEKEFAAEFGCARATINRALVSLAQRGVLERRRRIGTRVALDAASTAGRCKLPLVRELVEKVGHDFSLRPLGATGRPPSAEVVERLFRTAPEDIMETRSLFLADDKIFCLEQLWHDAALLPALWPAMQAGAMAGEWMDMHATASLLENEISARTAEQVEAAEFLDCPAAAPVLVFQSCIWIGNQPASYSRHVLLPGNSITGQFV